VDADWQSLIEAIHRSPVQCVIAVTGGGSSAIADLLAVPGGSRTLLEAVVPYASQALTAWLGREPEHFCCEETALAMASVACERACKLARSAGDARPAARKCVGLACTASLASDRPKKGAHRAFMAAHHDRATRLWSVHFQKEVRARAQEELLTGQLLLSLLADAAGVQGAPAVALLPGETLDQQCAPASPREHDLISGRLRLVWSLPEGQQMEALDATVAAGYSPPKGLLPGAFNPLHAGHTALRAAAERVLQGPVYFEMSVRNVDKPPLDFLTIARRKRQFHNHPLALTMAPTFEEKSALLPGVTFVVGVDTAERIVHPRYYGNSTRTMLQALETINRNGCRFLVAGRKQAETYRTLAEIALPEPHRHLFEALPESAFRVDLSSTELRQKPRRDAG
jgi:nicotinic acid mononucleotide adenylyltransferase/nicotinamide mononucleotide (NMN) deamidase PncC